MNPGALHRISHRDIDGLPQMTRLGHSEARRSRLPSIQIDRFDEAWSVTATVHVSPG
jgi:hypothetical protein